MTSKLESIEEKTLSYLSQVVNPLVRIDVLHTHLSESTESLSITFDDLKGFLVAHTQVRIIEAIDQASLGDNLDLKETESSFSPYAILVDRVPTEGQLAAMMLEQLESMHEALVTAGAHAQKDADAALAMKVSNALNRLDVLKQKLVAPPDSSTAS